MSKKWDLRNASFFLPGLNSRPHDSSNGSPQFIAVSHYIKSGLAKREIDYPASRFHPLKYENELLPPHTCGNYKRYDKNLGRPKRAGNLPA